MNTSIISPGECTPSDLAEFERLVVAGGAVDPNGLDGRIRHAFRLLFCRTDDGQLIGAAALKRPGIGYRSGVFERAHATESPDDYTTEIGWIVVAPSHRGQLLPLQFIEQLLPHAQSEPTFATTHSRAIEFALSDAGFRRHGDQYPSKRDNYNLVLYVRRH